MIVQRRAQIDHKCGVKGRKNRERGETSSLPLHLTIYKTSPKYATEKELERGMDSPFPTQLTSTVSIQLQWNLSFGTSPFRGHKIWSQKNVHLIFVFVTSIEGTPLFRGKGHVFWVPKLGFNLHSGGTLALEKWLTTKSVDKFKCTPARMTTAFTTWSTSLKSIYCTCGNSTNNVAEISSSWFCIHYLAAWNNDCSRFRGRI